MQSSWLTQDGSSRVMTPVRTFSQEAKRSFHRSVTAMSPLANTMPETVPIHSAVPIPRSLRSPAGSLVKPASDVSPVKLRYPITHAASDVPICCMMIEGARVGV